MRDASARTECRNFSSSFSSTKSAAIRVIVRRGNRCVHSLRCGASFSARGLWLRGRSPPLQRAPQPQLLVRAISRRVAVLLGGRRTRSQPALQWQQERSRGSSLHRSGNRRSEAGAERASHHRAMHTSADAEASISFSSPSLFGIEPAYAFVFVCCLRRFDPSTPRRLLTVKAYSSCQSSVRIACESVTLPRAQKKKTKKTRRRRRRRRRRSPFAPASSHSSAIHAAFS